MASASLSSLLGFMSPLPVIAPSAVDKRLSKTELRVATSAFHRARGYGDRIDFPRFRDTVVQEAFDAMPRYVVQRVFMVWNYVDGSTGGALTLEEFLVGVTIAWKGTREEHLRFVFQLMDRAGDKELSKRDAVLFLKAVALQDGVVAVEESSGRQWTAEEFAAGVLFTNEKTDFLTPSKFLKLLANRSFTSLALVDWIPKVAAQFEREKAKLVAAITPVTKEVDDQGDDMVASIMIKLRRLSSDESPVATKSKSSSGTWSPASPLAIAKRLVQNQNGVQQNSIFEIEIMTADQFQSLKVALWNLIEWALETNEPVSDGDIQQRLRGVLSSTLLQAVMNTATLCAGDFVLSASSLDKTTSSAAAQDAVTCQAKVQVFWWMLCICCSCARSSAEVFRYLFVLFDQESRGFWTMSQLKTFIRCVDFQDEEQSSSDEAAFLAQTVLDEFEATKQQQQHQQHTLGHSQPSRIADEEPVMFRFRDFEKYLVRHPIAGCSPANVDVVFTLFHTQLAKARGQQLSHRVYLDALSSFCDQLTTFEITTQHGFCLLLRSSWERIVDWICDYDSDLPLATSLKTLIVTTVDVPQCSSEGNEDGHQTTLVAVPISLWLILAMRLQERHLQQTTSHQHWTKSVSRLCFSTNSDGENSGKDDPRRNGSWVFHGLVTTLDLTVAARDGSECRITMPHCVVDQELSLQALVQTALTLHGREQRGSLTKAAGGSLFAKHPLGAFYCEGEVVFSRDGGMEHHQQVSQGIVLIALNALDEGAHSHRLAVKMNVLLTDERSNSSIPRWPAGALLSSPASSQRSTSSSPSSRTPRQSKRSAAVGWTKVHGLANLGNTCFMNSALQCLAATPVLREYFLKGEHLFDLCTHTTPTSGSSTSNGRKPANKMERVLPKSSLLPVAFGQLLAEMNAYSSNGSVSGMADVVSPKHMKGAVATLFPHLSDGTQQDAQEFLSSLLSSLSDELKRLPVVESHTSAEPVTAVDSPSLLSRFVTKTEKNEPPKQPSQTGGQAALSKLRFQVNDSDGRSDEVVAKEWWISHLVTEPSIITALFCGQFKSTLRCTHCGYTSTRFEPFSSLQLPLLDETTMLSPRRRPQHQQITVILHFMDSPCHTPSLRLAIQAGLDWTVDQLLIKIQQDHATYSSAETRRDHIAVSLSGFVIDDYIDPEALLSTVATPLHLFEIEYGDQARSYSNVASSVSSSSSSSKPFQPGDSVLARASHERWVKGIIERPAQAHSGNGTLSPVRSPSSSSSTAYHVRIHEANCGASVCLNPCDLRPLTTDRLLLLRFVHRRPGLVPFYSTSPYRQVLCGFPFVYRLPFSLLCGRALYHTIYAKFCSHESESLPRRSFVLRRVRSDGKSCGRCHWSDQCSGCLIDRLDEEPLLDLEMDETIAIDWILDAHEPVAEWLSSGYCIDDHTSYVAFKLDNTYTLEKSLDILCSSESVEARCSHCPKKAPVDAEQLTLSSMELPSPTTSPFVAHTKSLALWSLPPVLVIQLKRFELVADGGFTYQRLNHNVDFPVENFDISKFLSPADHTNPSSDSHAEREEVVRAESFLTGDLQFPTTTTSRDDVSRYHLYGVVNHMGDLGGGHYTAHIRHPDNSDWWLVDDASATPANPQNLAPSCSAYLLFYVREDLDPTVLDDEDDEDDDQDQEEQDFMNKTELPKNRRRVPLSEFYPRRNHATRVDDAAIRALCKQDVWPRTASASKTSEKRDDGNCILM